MSIFLLSQDNARERFKAAWEFACGFLELGKRVRVQIDEALPVRTLDQNAKFHAICGELAEQKQWAGEFRDVESWKRLLVDAWARHENRSQVTMVPALDGNGVVQIGIQTRNMRMKDMADLITFAQSYCDQNEIITND